MTAPSRDRMRSAYHEAGHVVIGTWAGRVVSRVSLSDHHPPITGVTEFAPTVAGTLRHPLDADAETLRYMRYLVSIAAGDEAGDLFVERDSPRLVSLRDESDDTALRYGALALTGDPPEVQPLITYLRAHARRLVTERAAVIHAVARSLLATDHLDGHKVAELIAAHDRAASEGVSSGG